MYKVVLVDDEIVIREGISRKIDWEKLGFELAATCGNGKEAIMFVQNHETDLVITDICMPYVDGLQLSAYLYQEYPQVEILILSGYDDFEYARKALKYKVSEYLLKPVTANELSEILSTIKGKMDIRHAETLKRNKIQDSYRKNRQVIRSNIMMNLMLGNVDDLPDEEELEEFRISLDASDFRACIIEIDPYKKIRSLSEEEKQKSSLMSFIVFNMADEVVGRHCAGEVFRGKGYRTCIVFRTNKPRELRTKIYGICDEIRQEVKRCLGFEITIAIGGYVKKIEELYRSYGQAEEALEYGYSLGDDRIIDCLELYDKESNSDCIRINIEQLLLAVKSNDRERIEELITAFAGNIKAAVLSKNRICLYIQNIIDGTGKMLKASDLQDMPIYAEKESVINEIDTLDSLSEALSCLREYCIRVSDELSGKRNTGGKKYAVLALDYIERHYNESCLNLNSVCTYLNISTSRFSTIFKNHTGLTFMEFLINKRMCKAGELLKNTDLKNYEIAEKVGFSDSHYFSAVFKKMMGCTPSQYAQKYRK